MFRVQSSESAEVLREVERRSRLQSGPLRERDAVLLQKEVSLFCIIKSLAWWMTLSALVGGLIGAGLGYLARREMQGWI